MGEKDFTGANRCMYYNDFKVQENLPEECMWR